MPITLLVRSATNDDDVPALTFEGGRVVIGRSGGCEVRLPDPSVSQRHATLRMNGNEFALIDEGSTNGTFVGGVRLAPKTPRALRDGDMVRVGRVWMEARIGPGVPTHDLKAKTKDIALALVARAMAAMGDDVVPRVSVVEGRDMGAHLRLDEEGRAYVIGRSETCDLPLAEADASREHLQVTRRGGVVLVRDLGSKNGALLGEVQLTQGRDVAWRGPSMIRIGSTVLALDEPVAEALISLESAEDEPIVADEVAPAPPPSLRNLPMDAGAEPSPEPPRAEAPIAPRPLEAKKRVRSAWSPTDIAIVIAAIVLIAVSIAGLFWLLRG